MPLVCHSSEISAFSNLVEERSIRRPPGIIIFPALRALAGAGVVKGARSFDRPSALRCLRVSGFSEGSGPGTRGGEGGKGEERADDDVSEVNPDCDVSSERDGVFSSASRP